MELLALRGLSKTRWHQVLLNILLSFLLELFANLKKLNNQRAIAE